MSENLLKPCPFCGSGRIEVSYKGNSVIITCKGCGIRYEQKFLRMSRESLEIVMTEHWNTRYESGVIGELVDACQTFVDRVDRGEVRSKRTYAQMKQILSKVRGER